MKDLVNINKINNLQRKFYHAALKFGALERQLLLMANGYTPLQTFARLTGHASDDLLPTAQSLVLEGFVKLVPAE